jgi:hypothetical protein
MRTISIARDFSATPGGRFNRDGPASGEAFRTRFLLPAISANEPVAIDLNGVAGLPSSFLEEAFGGIFRSLPEITLQDAQALINIKASEPDLTPYVELINRYMSEASRAQRVTA